jgi:hypothetical protein
MVPKAGDETHILAGPRTGVNSGGRWRATDFGCSRGIRIRTRLPTRAMSSMTSRTSRGSAARSVAGSRHPRARGAATVAERPRLSSRVAERHGTRSSRAVGARAARTSGAGRSVIDAPAGRFTRTGTKSGGGPNARCDLPGPDYARRTTTAAPRPSPRRSTALAALAAISRWSVLPKSAQTSPSPISE